MSEIEISTPLLSISAMPSRKNRAIFSLKNGRLIWYLELKSGTGKSQFKKSLFFLNRTMFDLRSKSEKNGSRKKCLMFVNWQVEIFLKSRFHCMYKTLVNVWGKRFKLPWLTHESFLIIDHSCKIFFWYLPNWTSTDLWRVVLYVTYSTKHQRLVEVQFGRYQKNILQEWYMVKKLSCVSHGSLKRFPHTFTIGRVSI